MVKTTRKRLKSVKNAADLLNILGYNTPPFDPFQLAEDLNITCDKTHITVGIIGCSGLLSLEKGRPNIWVNPFDSEERKRFTVAHELGHFILHTNKLKKKRRIMDFPRTLYSADTVTDPYEQDANRFALELLMPEDSIRAYMRKMTERNGHVFKQLAEAYQVSLATLERRLRLF